MAKRFSNIKKGGEYKKALDSYTTYLTDLGSRTSARVTGSGTPGTRGKSQSAGVRLFASDIAAGKYVLAKVSEIALSAAGGNFDTIAGFGIGADKRVEYEVDAVDVVGEPEGYATPARLTVFKPGAGASVYKRSKYTGLWYIKYSGKSFSTPFGRKFNVDGTTERFATARAQIIASLKGNDAGQFPRISIREENFDANS